MGPFDRSSLQASLAEALAAAARSAPEDADPPLAHDPAAEAFEEPARFVRAGGPPPGDAGPPATGGLDGLDELSLRGWGRPTAHRAGPTPADGGVPDEGATPTGPGSHGPLSELRPVQAFTPARPSGGTRPAAAAPGEGQGRPEPLTERGPSLRSLSPETAALLGVGPTPPVRPSPPDVPPPGSTGDRAEGPAGARGTSDVPAEGGSLGDARGEGPPDADPEAPRASSTSGTRADTATHTAGGGAGDDEVTEGHDPTGGDPTLDETAKPRDAVAVGHLAGGDPTLAGGDPTLTEAPLVADSGIDPLAAGPGGTGGSETDRALPLIAAVELPLPAAARTSPLDPPGGSTSPLDAPPPAPFTAPAPRLPTALTSPEWRPEWDDILPSRTSAGRSLRLHRLLGKGRPADTTASTDPASLIALPAVPPPGPGRPPGPFETSAAVGDTGGRAGAASPPARPPVASPPVTGSWGAPAPAPSAPRDRLRRRAKSAEVPRPQSPPRRGGSGELGGRGGTKPAAAPRSREAGAAKSTSVLNRPIGELFRRSR